MPRNPCSKHAAKRPIRVIWRPVRCVCSIPRKRCRGKAALFAYGAATSRALRIDATQTLEHLHEFGFHVTPDITICESIEEVVASCEKWAERRFELRYDIDGLVIKIDDLSLRDRLGTTAKHVKWAIAYNSRPNRV
ncbi:MAG UNVERIFIED_CONTAM: hypothetical protein LVQ98_05445 [Rickettsiaceae bacterium]